jgi:hypothetical protein
MIIPRISITPPNKSRDPIIIHVRGKRESNAFSVLLGKPRLLNWMGIEKAVDLEGVLS